MSDTLRDVPKNKLLEFPVAEDMQMGCATGMSLEGWLPICIYPRWNFMLLAVNQLINHLDRIPIYSDFDPKVIIRVAAPSKRPLDPGPQHDDDFTEPFRLMLRTVRVVTLDDAAAVVPAYREAMDNPLSTILVEYTQHYNVVPSGVPEKEKVAA